MVEGAELDSILTLGIELCVELVIYIITRRSAKQLYYLVDETYLDYSR